MFLKIFPFLSHLLCLFLYILRRPILLHVTSHILLIILIWQMLNTYHYFEGRIEGVKQVTSGETKPGEETFWLSVIFLIIHYYRNIDCRKGLSPSFKNRLHPFLESFSKLP